jgi:O-methyltransferase
MMLSWRTKIAPQSVPTRYAMKLPKLTPPDLDAIKNFFFPMFWSTSDHESVAQSIHATLPKLMPGVHFADNFLTWGRNNSMFDDLEFVAAWQNNAETDADRAIVWRRYILACAGYHCAQLDGDFVECGAYKGVGIKTVIDYLGGKEFRKTFWGYDLFEHDASMAHHSMDEHGPGLFDEVKAKFVNYDCVNLIKGEIPKIFEGHSPQQIAYLHIDLNEAPAEIAALDCLFDRVVPSGMVILDDYEWAGAYRPQKLAEDPWFEARGYRVMPLPTGQGLVFKR